MKVLVTGGAGFIGSHIVDLLIEEGCSVAVVDNLISGDKNYVNPKARFYEADITQKELDKVMELELPEIIIHQAALVFVQQSIQNPVADNMVNAMGTLNILQVAGKQKVRKIIYASTCAVYGETEASAVNEEFPVRPISFYGASKYMGEVYLRLFYELQKIDYTILRYANVYGPRQKMHGEGGVVPIFLQKMKEGTAPVIFGNGEQTRDFVYVKDVAKANVLAIHKGSRQTLNIGSGMGTTINELYQRLSHILGVNFPAKYQPARPGDVKHISLESAKAKTELGWQPGYSLLAGLKETVELFYP
jgi:UDP-glucose 4-epimerase